MAKVKKIQKKPRPFNPDAQGLFLIALGFLCLLALFSFSYLAPKQNWLGYVGYTAALGGEYLFGLGAYLIPFYLIWLGTRLLSGYKLDTLAFDHVYFLTLLGSSCLLLTVFAEKFPAKAALFDGKVVSETLALYTPYPRTLIRHNLGGVPFYFLFTDLPGINLQRILSSVGTMLIFSSLAIVSLLLLTRVKVVSNSRAFWLAFLTLLHFCKKTVHNFWKKEDAPPPVQRSGYSGLPPSGLKINLPEEKKVEEPKKKKLTEILKEEPPAKEKKAVEKEPIKKVVVAPPSKPAPKEIIPVPIKNLIVRSDSSYKIPSANLLSSPSQKIDQPTLKKDLMQQAAVLEETLKSFGIEAKVGEINSGPTITSFEVHPSIGVKVQKIKALESDIALNMQAKSIRIVAPIPGKAAVGVEVPALHPQEVNFKEMLLHYQQQKKKH